MSPIGPIRSQDPWCALRPIAPFAPSPRPSHPAVDAAHPRVDLSPRLMEQAYLPKSVLYATSARVGGVGLDAVALETLRGLKDQLGLAIAYGLRTSPTGDHPSSDADAWLRQRHLVKNLSWHPVRLLSNLQSRYYYAAKKRAVDSVAAKYLRTGRFDLFHGWSGEALQSLQVAKSLGIPTLLEVPTWHRQKGKTLPPKTEQELAMENAPVPQRWLNRLLISRQESLVEYETADLLLVLSAKAAETFTVLGTPKEKLYPISRGVDVNRFVPGPKPSIFRAVFVGALIKRKGVHWLIEAWRRLKLPSAELWLAGHPHTEIQPFLKDLPENVKLLGFTKDIVKVYQACSLHIFPSECEGSAKSTYEAAACGLPQITTRESGDVVVDGENGLLVPPNNVDALFTAITKLYENPKLREELGQRGRDRVVQHFTWDHFRERLQDAYRTALKLKSDEVAAAK
ncbi:MAG TPA: glycosyltransferase family 4 protein [Chthoniobacterales bacterium]